MRDRLLRIAMARRPLRFMRNRSRPFEPRGCSTVAQYATPARTLTGAVVHEFQAPARGCRTRQRVSRADGRPRRLR